MRSSNFSVLEGSVSACPAVFVADFAGVVYAEDFGEVFPVSLYRVDERVAGGVDLAFGVSPVVDAF